MEPQLPPGHSRAAPRSIATLTSALATATTATTVTAAAATGTAASVTTTAATTAATPAQFADDFDNIQLRPHEGPSIEAMGEMMPVLIKLRKVAS